MRRGLCGQNCRHTAATVGNCRTAVDRSAPAAAKHCAHEPLSYSARLAASPIAGGITEFVSATALLFGILSATAAERLAVKPALGSVVLHAKFEVGMAECVFAAALQNENMRCQVNGDRKSTRLNSSHVAFSYAVFGLTQKIDDIAT